MPRGPGPVENGIVGPHDASIRVREDDPEGQRVERSPPLDSSPAQVGLASAESPLDLPSAGVPVSAT